MQIRYRLTLQFILIVAGILLAALFYIHFQFRQNLQDEFYGGLRSKALMTAEMIVGKASDDFPLKIQEHRMQEGLLSGDYTENISIYDQSGARIYTFNSVPAPISPATLNEIKGAKECRFIAGKYSAFGLLYLNRAGKKYIVVAEGIFNTAQLDNLSRILLLVFLVSISLVAAGGWFFAGQALAPVSRIMNEVDELLPSDMSQRLETAGQKDELSRLVVTFNKLLDRIQSAFRTQKLFLSNISHELKNPLNVIVSQVEIALDKERSGEEYRQTLSSVLSDVKELNDVADKLMQMARINSDGSAIRFQPVRIDEIVWQAKAALLKSNPEYKVCFEVANLPEDEEKLLVSANEQLLKTALINLLDNGCKFSPDRNVKVRLSIPPEGAPAIEIEDQGPGIRAEEMPFVFDAFYRSPRAASVKGSGVGLSLVDSIMKLHRIELAVASRQGQGTTFRLNFPAESLN